MNAPTQQTTLAAMRTAQTAPNEATMPAVRAGFFDLQAFELIQRVSKAFASSDLVPKQYQGNLANCMIAMDMAQRIGANPLMVMQNLYIVHGTPGWSSKFLIATINACGRYSSLRYEWKGESGSNDFGCRAWAIERETGERLDGIWVTWLMVKAEGWDAKNGSKWKTMPDQMFVYRSAAFWQRAYAPELGMGLQTDDEIRDVFNAERGRDGSFAVDTESLRRVQPESAPAAEQAEGSIDVQTGEITSGAPTKNEAPAPTAQALTFAALTDRMQKATDPDVLDADADLIRELPDDQQEEATAIYRARRAELTGDVPAQAQATTRAPRTRTGAGME